MLLTHISVKTVRRSDARWFGRVVTVDEDGRLCVYRTIPPSLPPAPPYLQPSATCCLLHLRVLRSLQPISNIDHSTRVSE